MIGDINKIYKAELTQEQFKKLSDFIYNNYGLKMPITKKVLVESRLHKRLKVLGIDNFTDYLNFVFSTKNHEEIVNMIDVISTNKTDFFRENVHFEFMKTHILPSFNVTTTPVINIWSAGCSSGEEPYTIAMTIAQYIETQRGLDFRIMATDISTIVLEVAKQGIYHESKVKEIPSGLVKKYFLKSKDNNDQLVRVVPELRSKVTFQRLNFMDASYPVSTMFDIIFCRNVLIYFDKQTQEKVINNLCLKLKKNGYLFLGHSESIIGINVPVKQIQPTIFQRI